MKAFWLLRINLTVLMYPPSKIADAEAVRRVFPPWPDSLRRGGFKRPAYMLVSVSQYAAARHFEDLNSVDT
jgi:hypothetical protein